MQAHRRMGGFLRVAQRRTAGLLALLVAAAAVVLAVPASAERLVDPIPNPGFPDQCGIDVAIVLDTSGSITSFGGQPTPENEAKMKNAAKLVVDTLEGTPSHVGVVSFRTLATLELPTTEVATTEGAAAVRNAIDAVEFGPTAIEVGTNWEDAFLKTAALDADVVLFATDGNPTTRNEDVANDPGVVVDDEDIDAGVAAANALKAQGVRIVAVGIGNILDVPNLIDISGPNENDDYYLSNFDTLAAALEDVALRLCAQSVTVMKLVDGVPTAGWQMDIEHNGAGLVVNPSDGVTDANGLVNYKWNSATPVTATITETLIPGFRFVGVSCNANGEPYPSTTVDHGVTLTVSYPDVVQCVFENTMLAPQIDLEKVADVQEAVIGDTVTYTYTVTNTGDLEITDLSLFDDVLGDIELAVTSLAPGESTTGTATHVVTAEDFAGPIVNVASVTGTVPETGGTVSDEDDETVDLAGVTVDKVADVQEAAVGDTITYTYTVTNVGSTTIVDLTVFDDILGDITVAATTLAPGESTTGTAQHVVTEEDLIGPIVNVVTAEGTTEAGTPVTSTDDETVDVTSNPAIAIVKTSDIAVAEVGDTVTYTYAVTNTGDVTLSDITVVDDVLGPITLATTTLAPGASTTGTATHVVAEDDLAGPLVNLATVTGTAPDGTPVTSSDDETVPLAAIDVVKVPDLQSASPGDTITYTYTVTNTGSITLTDITVVDDVIGPITLATTTLAPGESTTGTATYLVTEADGTGPVDNVALATGTYTNPETDEPGTVTDSDDASVPIVLVLPTTTIATSSTSTTTPSGGSTTTIQETLPRTGGELERMATAGAALVLLGGLVLLAARRRHPGSSSAR